MKSQLFTCNNYRILEETNDSIYLRKLDQDSRRMASAEGSVQKYGVMKPIFMVGSSSADLRKTRELKKMSSFCLNLVYIKATKKCQSGKWFKLVIARSATVSCLSGLKRVQEIQKLYKSIRRTE